MKQRESLPGLLIRTNGACPALFAPAECVEDNCISPRLAHSASALLALFSRNPNDCSSRTVIPNVTPEDLKRTRNYRLSDDGTVVRLPTKLLWQIGAAPQTFAPEANLRTVSISYPLGELVVIGKNNGLNRKYIGPFWPVMYKDTVQLLSNADMRVQQFVPVDARHLFVASSHSATVHSEA